jgi:hypothetical protein
MRTIRQTTIAGLRALSLAAVLVACSAAAAGAQTPTHGPDPDNGAVVLMYHRFGEDSLPSTSVRLAQFDAH